MGRKCTLLVFGVSLFFPFLHTRAQERVLLDERFVNYANAWPEYDNDNNRCKVFYGAYEAETKPVEGTWLGSIVVPLGEQNDFTLEASMKRLSGADNYGYGIVWGVRDANNFFYFNITGTGYYKYGKCENGTYSDLIDWTISPAIRKVEGANPATNTLKIKRTARQLAFSINDTYASQTAFLPFFGQKIGFAIFRQMKVQFTSLRVTQTIPGGGERIVLKDDFSNNNNLWQYSDNTTTYSAVLNGTLILEGKEAEGSFTNTIPAKISQQGDFAIQATLRKMSGNDNTGYGLTWGYLDGSNTFIFQISGNGYYNVLKRVGGKDIFLVPWEQSSAIVPGNGANALMLKKEKNTLGVFINGTLVKTVAFEPFFGNRVGFKVDRVVRVQAEDILIKETAPLERSSDQERLVLNEDFQDNRSRWDECSDADNYLSVQRGKYVFEEKRATGSRLSTIPLQLDGNKDFTIESTFDKVSGVDNNGFGIVWGLKDASNFYRVLITGNGHYLYGKSVNAKYVDIGEWAVSDAINQYNARNKVTIRKKGSSFSLFINDKYINTYSFEPFFGNAVGFVNHHLKRIEVENLSVKESSARIAATSFDPNQGNILFQDDFTSDANTWYELNDEMAELKKEYGKYSFEHKRTIGGYITWMPSSLDAYTDFTISSTIRKVGGVDNYGYGILWGGENNKNYYYFLLSGNGRYVYGKTVNGTSTSLCQWTANSVINRQGGLNRLSVKKTGDKLVLSVNDQAMQTFPFDGSFGTYVGYKVDNHVKIEISDVLITKASTQSIVTRKEIKKDTTPPLITILEPQTSRGMKPTVKEKITWVRGKATDESGVFDVMVNDAEARISETGEFEAAVKLKVGENVIVVRASDTKNNVAEERFTVVREAEQFEATAKSASSSDIQGGTYYALLIGVQEYADKSVGALDHPIADAQQVMKAITENYTFDTKNVVLLKNPDRKTIIRTFNDLKNKLTSGDNLFVFYAGHGYWDQDLKQGFWLPSDAAANDPSDWISNGTIRDFVRGIKSKHTLLIADACFSGGIFKTRDAFSKVDLSTQKIYEMPSRRAMTSGALKTVPDRSVFVEYLLKRLTDNRDKYLMAEKLYINMKEAVINNSPNNQTPLYGVIGEAGDEGGDFIFVHR